MEGFKLHLDFKEELMDIARSARNSLFQLLFISTVRIWGVGSRALPPPSPNVFRYQLYRRNHYSPQTKLPKGNVFTSVCPEFCPRRGEVYTPGHAPPGQTPPRADIPLGRPPPGRHISPGQTPPGQTAPWQTPPPSEMVPSADVRILLECILV